MVLIFSCYLHHIRQAQNFLSILFLKKKNLFVYLIQNSKQEHKNLAQLNKPREDYLFQQIYY